MFVYRVHFVFVAQSLTQNTSFIATLYVVNFISHISMSIMMCTLSTIDQLFVM